MLVASNWGLFTQPVTHLWLTLSDKTSAVMPVHGHQPAQSSFLMVSALLNRTLSIAIREIQRGSWGCLLAVLSASSTLFFLLTFLVPLKMLKFDATDRNSYERTSVIWGSCWHLGQDLIVAVRNVPSWCLDSQHLHSSILNVAKYAFQI